MEMQAKKKMSGNRAGAEHRTTHRKTENLETSIAQRIVEVIQREGIGGWEEKDR